MNKKLIYLFLLAGLICLAFPVFAQQLTNPLAGAGITTFTKLLEKIADAIAPIIGALAVLMLIVSGILFLFGAASPGMVTKARAALMFAIIGAAIGLAASGLVALLKSIIGA